MNYRFIVAVVAIVLLLNFASAADPGHSAGAVGPGSFETGNYSFPSALNITGSVAIGQLSQAFAAFNINSSSAFGSIRVINGSGFSHFFINGSTGYVGIGTAAPSSKLEVNGSLYLNGNFNNDKIFNIANIGGGSISLNDTTADSAVFLPELAITTVGSDGQFKIRSNSNDGSSSGGLVDIIGQVNGGSVGSSRPLFRILDHATTRLLIDGAGNIGIGHTNPSALLHLGTGNITLSGGFITNVSNPLVASDVATKSYVDSITGGSGNSTDTYIPYVGASKNIDLNSKNLSLLRGTILSVNTPNPGYALNNTINDPIIFPYESNGYGRAAILGASSVGGSTSGFTIRNMPFDRQYGTVGIVGAADNAGGGRGSVGVYGYSLFNATGTHTNTNEIAGLYGLAEVGKANTDFRGSVYGVYGKGDSSQSNGTNASTVYGIYSAAVGRSNDTVYGGYFTGTNSGTSTRPVFGIYSAAGMNYFNGETNFSNNVVINSTGLTLGAGVAGTNSWIFSERSSGDLHIGQTENNAKNIILNTTRSTLDANGGFFVNANTFQVLGSPVADSSNVGRNLRYSAPGVGHDELSIVSQTAGGVVLWANPQSGNITTFTGAQALPTSSGIGFGKNTAGQSTPSVYSPYNTGNLILTGNANITNNLFITTTGVRQIVGNFTMGSGGWITNVSNPLVASDVATKSYVDALTGGAGSTLWSRSGTSTYLNNTGDKVGVGTTTPITKLDVAGGIAYGTTDHRDFFEAAEYQTGNTDNNMTINTNIPFISSSVMPYITIDGYQYGGGETIGLNIVFYIYNNDFTSYTASSFGSYVPTAVTLFNNTAGNVSINIYDAGGLYYSRFKVAARKTLSESDSYMTGWYVDNKGVPPSGISDQVNLTIETNVHRLGIGTSDPTGLLHVSNGSADVLFANSLGNVGIGTSSPVSKLDVNGSGIFRNSWINPTSASTQISYESGLASGLIGAHDGTNRLKLTFQSSNYLFETGSGGTGSRVAIDTSGNLGIGTTAPQQKLHINGSDGAGYLQLTTSVTGGSSTDGTRIGYNSGDFRIQNYEAGLTQFLNGSQALVSIDNFGNITLSAGRWITNVSNPLVAQDVATKAYVDALNASSGSADDWNLSGSDLFPKSLSYFVGIGTNDPAARLHVAGTDYTATNLNEVWNNPHVRFRLATETYNTTLLITDAASGLVPGIQAASGNETARSLALNPYGGNVGIGLGALNPSYKLHVDGPVAFGRSSNTVDFRLQRALSGVNTSQHWYVSSANSPHYTYGENLNWTGELTGNVEATHQYKPYFEDFAPILGYRIFGFINATSGSFTSANMTNNLILKNDGLVGIGNVVPSAPLHVNTTAAGAGIRITSTAGSPQLQLGNGTNQHVGGLSLDTSGFFNIGDAVSGNGDIGTRIYSADIERVRVTAAGLVGINSTNPTHTLTVGGNVSIVSGTSGDTAAVLRLTGSSTGTGDVGTIEFQDGSSDYMAKISGFRAGGVDEVGLKFYTKQTGGAPTAVAQFGKSGNLSFLGTQWITGLQNPLAAQDAATKAYVDALNASSGTADDWNLTGSNLIPKSLDYNIGLGTTSPTEKLQIQGGLLVTANDSSNYQSRQFVIYRSLSATSGATVQLGNFSFSNGAGYIEIDHIAHASGYSTAAKYLIPVQYGNEDQALSGQWLKVQPVSYTGDYGSEEAELDVYITAATTAVRVRRVTGSITATHTFNVRMLGNTGSYTYSNLSTDGVTAPTNVYGPATLTQRNARVGIGTTNPLRTLDVNGTILLQNNQNLSFRDASGNVRRALSYTSGNVLQIGSDTSHITQILSQNTQIIGDSNGNLQIDPVVSGGNITLLANRGLNVGIGTNTPSNKLYVNAVINSNDGINIGDAFRLRSSTANNAFVLEHLNASGDLYIRSQVTGDTNGSLILNDLGGNVGIGTTAPVSKLHIASGNVTVAGWINNLSNPILASDAATKAYVDALNTSSGGNGTNTYVPYVGANSNVNLGIYNLTTNGRVGIVGSPTQSNLFVNGSIESLISTGGNLQTKHYQDVASFSGTSAPMNAITGELVIGMPKNWSDSMLHIKIQGYDYSSRGAWEVIVGGYNYNSQFWINTNAEIRGRPPFTQVRLASNGTRNVIILGNATTVWSYPQIVVSDVLVGFGGLNDWGVGWSIYNTTIETGLVNIASPTIYQYTDQSGNVGIGTTSPAGNLDLKGSADTKLRIYGTTTAHDSYLELLNELGASSEGFRIRYDNDVGDTYIDNIWNGGSDSNPALRFRTKTAGTAVDALTISHGGNVGIGTTTPSRALDVRGVGNFSGTIYYFNNTDLNANLTSIIANLNAVNSSSSASEQWNVTNSVIYPRDYRYNVTIGASNAEIVAGSRLTVNGTIATTNGYGLNLNGYKTYSRSYTVNGSSINATLVNDLGTNLTPTQSYLVRAVTTGTSTQTGAMAYFHGDQSIGFTQHTLYEAGKSSNHVHLYMEGNTPKVKLYDHPSQYTVYVIVEEIPDNAYGGSIYLNLYNDIANSRIGLGTTGPVGKFSINNSVDGVPAIVVNNSGGGVWGQDAPFFKASYANTYTDFYTGAGNQFIINTTSAATWIESGSNAIVLQGAGLGNVSIGNAAPSSKLHLSVGNVDGIRVESSNSGYLEVGKTSGSRWRLTNNYNSDLFEILYGSGGSTPGTSRLAIDTSGNLGIGTTTPSRTLDVRGVGNFSGTIYYFNNTDLNANLTSIIANLNAVNSSGSAADDWNVSGSNLFPKDLNYNVSIGTNSASNAKLRIVGGNSVVETPLRLAKGSYADSGGHTTLLGFGVENAVWSKGAIGYTRTGSYDVGYFGFYLNNVSSGPVDVNTSDARMVITNAGNVGISTTSPQSTLEVKGTFNASTPNGGAHLASTGDFKIGI